MLLHGSINRETRLLLLTAYINYVKLTRFLYGCVLCSTAADHTTWWCRFAVILIFLQVSPYVVTFQMSKILPSPSQVSQVQLYSLGHSRRGQIFHRDHILYISGDLFNKRVYDTTCRRSRICSCSGVRRICLTATTSYTVSQTETFNFTRASMTSRLSYDQKF